ncbi:MAG TPA: FecR domain-containing protein [Rhizomicrobium sp.]|nr:FecR domain-containing protein [Rhizomicrobium sp.]
MSDSAPNLSPAKDARAQAGQWLERREFGPWTDADQAELDAWLAASPSNMVAFLRVERVWNRAERLRALNRPMREQSPAPQKTPLSVLPKLAAAFAFVAAFGIGAYLMSGNGEKSYETPIGIRKTITFADGSKVELNTDTVLRARVSDSGRMAELVKGEAFFQIQHDAAHPFVVTAAGYRVTDLGTKFLVRRDGKRLEVTLVEGSARVDPASPDAHGKSTVLSPGDMVLATDEGLKVTKKTTPVLANEMAWRRGLLIFNHATLAEAAAEFNRYNSQKLVIANPTVARRTIGGTFPTSGVEEFAEVAKGIFGFHVKTQGNDIVIQP